MIGETGTLHLDYGTVTSVGDDTNTEWSKPHAGTGKPESTNLSLNRLLTAFETDAEPANSGHDNLKTIALLDIAYRSAVHNAQSN